MTGLNVATNTFICWPIGSVRKAIMLAFNFWSATSREQRSQLDLPPLETQTVAIATSYRIGSAGYADDDRLRYSFCAVCNTS
jgi:hypothetical protein